LGRLRELLDDPLFERHGNEMIPTPRARELAATVGRSLSALQELLHGDAIFEPASCDRTFTIAMREAHESVLLPSLIEVLGKTAPHVSVATVRNERRELEEDLETGELDIAVDMPLPLSADIHREAVHREPLVVLARKDHPIVREALDVASYLSLDHVLVTGRRRGMGLEDAALQRMNMTRRIRVRCQRHAAANEIVSRSDLVATMPRSYAELVNRHIGNQMLPFPVEIPMLELFMYWHVNVDDDAAHRWFRELALKFI
jgi:DNA-binding transcriptional LysR family regulator